jgi:hypothetical protein
VLVIVIVLIVTNLATLGALVWLHVRPAEQPAPDTELAASLGERRRPAGTTRRIITIEILNPVELAGTRGRLAGIAGSLAPGIARRIVYDQAIRTLRHQLAQERVVADVRLHTVPAADRVEPTDRSEPAGRSEQTGRAEPTGRTGPTGRIGPVAAEPEPAEGD